MAPPATFLIYTLNSSTGNQQTLLGGATDQPSACALAAALAQTLRVGIGVYGTGGTVLVAYVKLPGTTTPP